MGATEPKFFPQWFARSVLYDEKCKGGDKSQYGDREAEVRSLRDV
jgi:hypothetical protein